METTELSPSGSRCPDMTPVIELCGNHPGGNRIFMKRDDLLPYALGGNKVRIALEFMKASRSAGADPVCQALFLVFRFSFFRMLNLSVSMV